MPPSLGSPHHQDLWSWTREDATGLISGGESLFIHAKNKASPPWPSLGRDLQGPNSSSPRGFIAKGKNLKQHCNDTTREDKTRLTPDNRGRAWGCTWQMSRESLGRPWGLQTAGRGGRWGTPTFAAGDVRGQRGRRWRPRSAGGAVTPVGGGRRPRPTWAARVSAGDPG